MESVKAIKVPVTADSVESPAVYYGNNVNDITQICFQTHDEQFGRITFRNLDAIKVCRGEMMPYEYEWGTDDRETWVFKIENSKWLAERYNYEKVHYGSFHEFGGNADEMLTDFKHLLFSFHDQFVEVITRDFWFEKSENNLFRKPLQIEHPFNNLPENKVQLFEVAGVKYKAIFNPIPIEQLTENTQYSRQTLIEIAIECDGKYSIDKTLVIMQRQEKIISALREFSGRASFEKFGIATFDDIKPIIDKQAFEIAERRKNRK